MQTLPKKFKLLLTTLLAAGLLSGCTPSRKPEPLPPSPPAKRGPVYTPPGTPTKRLAPFPEDVRRLNMMLIRKVNGLPGVKNSSIAVVNTTAYAGVEKDASLSSAQVQVLKRDLPKTIKTFEPRITTVMLTFRPEIKKRISKVANDMGQGRPASIYASDLREIINNCEPVR